MTITEDRIKYIRQNDDLTANEIIENWKGSNLAIRRKDGLKLIRETRHIKPKPNRKKYIPTKYKIAVSDVIEKPKIELPEYPEKHGYNLSRVTVTKGVDKGKKYFIAWKDSDHFNEQYEKILSSYGHNLENTKVKHFGFKAYEPFIAPEFIVD